MSNCLANNLSHKIALAFNAVMLNAMLYLVLLAYVECGLVVAGKIPCHAPQTLDFVASAFRARAGNITLETALDAKVAGDVHREIRYILVHRVVD